MVLISHVYDREPPKWRMSQSLRDQLGRAISSLAKDVDLSVIQYSIQSLLLALLASTGRVGAQPSLPFQPRAKPTDPQV